MMRENQEVIRGIHKELASAASLNGFYTEAEQAVEQGLNMSGNMSDRVDFYIILIQRYCHENDNARAVRIGVEYLGRIDPDMAPKSLPMENLSMENLSMDVGEQKAELDDLFRDIDLNDLLDHRLMTDPEHIARMRLLNMIGILSYDVDPGIWAFLIKWTLKFQLEHGLHPEIFPAFCAYGIMLVVFQEYSRAYQFGRFAYELCRKHGFPPAMGSVCYYYSGFLKFWEDPIGDCLAMQDEALEYFQRAGDGFFMAVASYMKFFYTFHSGRNLATLSDLIPGLLNISKQTRQEFALDSAKAFQLALANLTGGTVNRHSFDMEGLSEKEFLANNQAFIVLSGRGDIYMLKTLILYLYHEYDRALENLEHLNEFLRLVPFMLIHPLSVYFQSLILAGLYSEADKKARVAYNTTFSRNRLHLKAWAGQSPANFEGLYLLTEAEIARAESRPMEAMALYDRAIASMHRYGYTHYEAMANELAGRFWMAQNHGDFAAIYLKRARLGYFRWGAKRKLALFEQEYKGLLADEIRDPAGSAGPPNGAAAPHLDSVDMAAVIRASQSISGEIVVENLMTTLMRVVLESAGARKGYLVVERTGRLFVHCRASFEPEFNAACVPAPLELMGTELSIHIVRYVHRTRERVVLDDASGTGMFARDDYVVSNRVRSLICLPVFYQAHLIAVLFLENNLITGAFTPDRLAVIDILAAQAAISMENARLYRSWKKASGMPESRRQTIGAYMKTR